MIKDFLGTEVKMDDYFAYPLTIGRSANMAIFQFKGLNKSGNVKARPVKRAYGGSHLFKYRKWDKNKRDYVDMTEGERAKVDAKLSTLMLFSQRALLLKDFKE